MSHGSRDRVAAIAVALSVATAGIGAQSSKTYRVGWLGSGNPTSGADAHSGEFRQALRDLKYIEGQNISLEYRNAGDNVGLLPELATELVVTPSKLRARSRECSFAQTFGTGVR